MRALIGLALLLALPASPVWAGASDTQFWSTQSASAPLTDRSTGLFEMSQRMRSVAAGGDQYQMRASLDLSLSKSASIGGGLVYASTAQAKEFRPYQELVLKRGDFNLRTRVEERLIEGSGITGIRLRERAQLQLRIDRVDRLIVSVEPYFVLRPANAGKPTGLEQVRLGMFEERKVSEHLRLTIGYLLIATPHNGSATHYGHVPQLILSWKG